MNSKIKVLFLCTENACRSQMAEGFARFYDNKFLEVFSAGSQPAEEVHPMAVQAMREKGIDIGDQKPKGIATLPNQEFDYVVTMGCAEGCPATVQARHRLNWDLPDPKDRGGRFFQTVRDKIERRVLDLLKTIEQEQSTDGSSQRPSGDG